MKNWNRPTEEVNGILVDKCIAHHVRFINSLVDTKTKWCCCGHGHKSGSTIEFITRNKLVSSLIIEKFGGKIEQINYQGIDGYALYGDFCKCNEQIQQRAIKHWHYNKSDMKEKEDE